MTERKLRLTLVISSLQAGGAERAMSSMANYWAERDVCVTLVTFFKPDDDHYILNPKIDRVEVDFFGLSTSLIGRFTGLYQRLTNLRHAIRSTQPDVVLSFVDKTNMRVLLSLIGTGCPVVVSERTNPERWPLSRIWQHLRRWTYPRAAGVVVQTQAVSDWAQTFMDPAKVHVIANAVRAELTVLQGSEERENLVLAIGRLSEEKGADLLLQAWARVASDFPAWRLQFLGDGPLRSSLQSMATTLGVDAQVEFVGVVDNPEDYLARSGLFVLPSRLEGFPNALLEAMALGNAVISFDCEYGPREIIGASTLAAGVPIPEDARGLLVPAQDVEALAEAMGRLLNDESTRRRLGQNAHAVCDQYSEKAIMAQWDAVLKGAVR